MNGSVAILVALITAIGTVTVGYFTLRATVRAAAAKEKVDDNASALAAWRELVQPLRDENARLVAQLKQERDEHRAVLAALETLNDRLNKGKGKL